VQPLGWQCYHGGHDSLKIAKDTKHLKHYTAQEIAALPTKQYCKTALTKARMLAAQDLIDRGGIIQTLEGPQTFEIGDFLCVGIAGEEWPMSRKSFLEGKDYFEDTEDGFCLYTTKGIKHAALINEQFSVDTFVSSENGGYVVHNGNPSEAWIVDKDIFDGSYEEIHV
jgi:hypothetical protein